MIVLAVDLGIITCGYVICKVSNLDIAILKEEEINPSKNLQLFKKLSFIFEKLEEEISIFKPQGLILENLYSHYKHPVTLGVLSQVKGVISLLAYKQGLSIFEYSPTRARKAFLGRGSGDSLQVQKMAENITGKKFKSVHTADAYSLVVAFSHSQKLKNIEILVENR